VGEIRVRFLSGFMIAGFSLPLGAAEPRSGLDFFLGRWTIQGIEASYSETCEWLPGGGFLACRAEDRSEGEPSYALSIFGYSELDGHYTYHGFGGSGGVRTLQGFVQDGVWRFQGQSGRAPAWRRWQVTITPSERGFHFREEVSERSGPWEVAAAFEYLRLGPMEP
jgi:hypothetical protein